MSIESLKKGVAPPPQPINAVDEGRWEKLEKTLGFALPKDYRDFAISYGSGRFYDPNRLDIRVINPLAPDYLKKVQNLADLFRELKEGEGDDYVPYGIFPEQPGLLPWASDDHRNTLFWLTEGPPNEWPIVLNADADRDFETVNETMTAFLAKVFSNRARCDFLWRKPFFTGPEKVRFEPIAPV